MKKLFILAVWLYLFFTAKQYSYAVKDPLSVPNNKVGIHIFNEKDLGEAAGLVNTNGDWGYVTFVVTEGERDLERWQKAFNEMRKLHLIPILRIASKASGDIWEKPKEEEIENWVSFLNSLNWVTENRYVVISNEPNHAAEWGGKVDPGGYAAYLKSFYLKLKEASSDFYILPAALDASANNSASTMEESRFIRNMLKAEPDIFNFIDGWNSHSYPNPAFSGLETDSGKGTISSYRWEISYLGSLGVVKKLPVFITETGWSNEKSSEDQISARLLYAFDRVWSDKNIVAVTPFILNYTNPPFAQFSWKKDNGSFYKFYDSIANLPKTDGMPAQVVKGDIVAAFAQPLIPLGSDYIGAILARNTGQSIWEPGIISIGSDFVDLPVKKISFQDIEPAKLGLVVFKASAQENPGIYARSLFLKDAKNERVTNSFPVEALVIKLDQDQIKNLWNNAQNYIKSLLKI